MSILVEVRCQEAPDFTVTIATFKHRTNEAADARLAAILSRHPASEVMEPATALYAGLIDGKVWDDLRYVVILPIGVDAL
jgi:hypothetical protein